MTKKLFLLLVLPLLFSLLWAQTDPPEFDENTLFADPSATLEPEAQTNQPAEPASATAQTDSTRLKPAYKFGGSFEPSLASNFVWYQPYDTMTTPDLIVKLDGQLYFDARPASFVRFYGKIKFGFPYYPVPDFTGFMSSGKYYVMPYLSLFELFFDFTVNDYLNFRFGKHTVTWGAGYFFNPADVINITAINPQDPSKQLEGPLSLRAQILVPKTQNAFWLYAVPDINSQFVLTQLGLLDFQSSASVPLSSQTLMYTAIAGKFEFTLGPNEFSIGGWYKYEHTPRLIATWSGSIKRTVGIFAEAVLGWGSDEEWSAYRTSSGSTGLASFGWYGQATIGFTYIQPVWQTGFVIQYFYNGFGSEHPDSLSLTQWAAKKSLYGYAGQHYLAASITKSNLISDVVGLRLFTMWGFSDLSGLVQLMLEYTPNRYINISAGPVFSFGKEQSSSRRSGEFTDGKPQAGFTAKIKATNLSF